MTQITIELSETLAQQLEDFLAEHPEESAAQLLKDALYVRQVPKDPAKILELAGVVVEAPRGAAENAEDFED